MHSIDVEFTADGDPRPPHARAPAETLQPGDLLGGEWRIERTIGKGGMGVVYAAYHDVTHERVAIKVMSDLSLRDPKAVARFAREIRVAMTLSSDHVARVRSIGRVPKGAPIMVMDLLDGEDLGALVRRVGALPIDEVIAWTLQACDAVGEAHAAGFIHRDLKLANLFLAQSQHGPMLKVLDFGLAKAMVRESDDQSLTGADTFLGTPHYMAPEMFMCARDVDARADVWALGICLYRMLTDRHPFETASVIALCANVLHSDPIPPSKHRRDLPPGLEEIVLLCLAREPGARFADARELAAALQALKARSRPRHVPFTLTRLHVAQPFVALPVEPDEAPTELRRLERTAPMPVGGHDPRRR